MFDSRFCTSERQGYFASTPAHLVRRRCRPTLEAIYGARSWLAAEALLWPSASQIRVIIYLANRTLLYSTQEGRARTVLGERLEALDLLGGDERQMPFPVDYQECSRMLPGIQGHASHASALPIKRCVEGVVYSVYGDESHDETADYIFVVAGLFGNDSAWEDTEAAWLNITRGEDFHANEWSRRPEYGALCRVLCQSKLIAHASGMDLRDYNNIFPNPVEQLPYYFCFSKVVEALVEKAAQCVPADKVKFTFDRNVEARYNASTLYDCMIKFQEFEHWELLADEIAFATRKSPKIQMADMVVREVMNRLMTIVQGGNSPRSTCYARLADSHRLHWEHFHKDYFAARVAHIQKFVDEGHPMGNYEEWRARKNCQDTTENRIRYHVQVDRLLGREPGGKLNP